MSMQTKEILTVSQQNENIKCVLEETFGFIWAEGEVSDLLSPNPVTSILQLRMTKARFEWSISVRVGIGDDFMFLSYCSMRL